MTSDDSKTAGQPPNWDKLSVPTGTSAIMTPAMARAVAASTPARAADADDQVATAPALSDLGEAAQQAIAHLREACAEVMSIKGADELREAGLRMAALNGAIDKLEVPSVKSGGWWPLGRGKEKEAMSALADEVAQVGQLLGAATQAVKGLGQMVRQRAALATRLRARVEVEAHSLEQVVDKGRRKAGGVIEALQRQAALAVDDGAKLRRIEEARRLTDEFTGRIEPMARVATAAARVNAVLKGFTVVADVERREAKLGQAASEWQQSSAQLDGPARLASFKEATEALSVEAGKCLRLIQAMGVARQELDAATGELGQTISALK